MSASTSGAVKAMLEGASLGVAVYRDKAAEGTKPPFITIKEGIVILPDPSFSQFDDPEGHVVEQASIDVWQTWRNPTPGVVVESFTLVDRILAACSGARLPTAPTPVCGFRVLGRIRVVEKEENIVHDSILVEIRRTLVHV